MDRSRDLYPTLVGVCVALLLAGGALLAVPRLAPAPLAPTVRPLAEPWLLGVVVLGVGGSLGSLLVLRSLH